MLQEIDEPVSVIALFDGIGVKPLRLKQGERVYHVRKVVNTWRQKRGLDHHLHVAVETREGLAIELVVDLADLSWRIAQLQSLS